ncbi:hypothetical protein [Pseudomonas sp. IT-232MI5]|jgi:hypothetical protein|uniref:hypothetical protein n=1 Tax=Pseudomonas sp. IT-232MI5 TaxID=3026442 RepID=UPI0039DFFA6C
MLNRVLSVFRNAKPNPLPKEIKEFIVKHDIKFDGFGGLNINRQVVREYGYLVRMLTEGRLDTLYDFREVFNCGELLLSSIRQELSRDVLRESEALGYSRQTTEGNMLRLQGLVETIIQYVALCDQYKVDPEAAREFEV